MKRWMILAAPLALALAALAAAAGCTGAGAPEKIPLMEKAPPEQKPDGIFTNAPSQKEAEGTRYFSAANAADAPRIKVSNARGKELTVQPGETGFVTLVGFISLDHPAGGALLLEMRNLDQMYRPLSFRCMAVIEPTPSAKHGEMVADRMGLAFPVYYDNLSQSALRTLAKAADAAESGSTPAVVIVDRHGRLRFYRPGFRYMTGTLDSSQPNVPVQQEIAPPGRTLRNYVESLLREP